MGKTLAFCWKARSQTDEKNRAKREQHLKSPRDLSTHLLCGGVPFEVPLKVLSSGLLSARRPAGSGQTLVVKNSRLTFSSEQMEIWSLVALYKDAHQQRATASRALSMSDTPEARAAAVGPFGGASSTLLFPIKTAAAAGFKYPRKGGGKKRV